MSSTPYCKLEDYILICAATSSALSIFGCLFIFWIFIKFSRLRSTSKLLLLYLTVADFFTAAGILWAVIMKLVDADPEHVSTCSNSSHACRVQSFVTTSSNLCSFFWMIVISFYFIIAIVKNNTEVAERIMFPSHMICWGVPILITFLALVFGALGEDQNKASSGWCWITECPNKGTRMLWMLVSGKLWEFICYMVLTCNYMILKYVVWIRKRQVLAYRILRIKLPDSLTRGQLSRADKMFIYVPIILIVLRIWGTIKFILSLSGGLDSEGCILFYTLSVLQALGDSGQGFWNFILFCLATEEVRTTFIEYFKRGMQRSPRESPQESDDDFHSSRGSITHSSSRTSSLSASDNDQSRSTMDFEIFQDCDIPDENSPLLVGPSSSVEGSFDSTSVQAEGSPFANAVIIAKC